MRVRDHIALSTASAAILTPWLGRDALGLWTGGVLIDGDHYVWFCLRERRLNPATAVRFFNQAQAPQHAATHRLHSPLVPLVVLLMGLRRPRFLALALGMAMHVALDRFHEGRMDRARAAALERDAFRCQACGVRGPEVGTHLRRQPMLLPSYEPENLISLCGPCHDAAHANGSSPWS